MSLITRWRDRRAEKRATLKVAEKWMLEAFGATKSNTGINVTPEKALTYTAVYACVRVLAETLAMLPLKVYERLERGKTPLPSHPLWPILHDRVSPGMTSFEYREFMMGNLQLRGNAYAFIERDGGGRPMELWPLRADQTSVELRKGKKVYVWKEGEREFTETQVHHIHGLSTDGITGLSPITLMREAVGMGLAHEEYGSRFFSQGANAGGVLKHQGELSAPAQKRLQHNFEQATEGLLKSHKTMILEEGMDWTKVGVDPKDAQFLEGRKFQVNEIARAFRVPPHLIGDLERATFTNIEHQGQEFVTYSMQPWFVRWEQAIARDLIMPSEEGRIFAEFLAAGLLRGDSAARTAYYQGAVNAGWMSRNEVRELENMNPVDGLDEYLVPLNMSTIDGDGNVIAPMPTEPRRLVTLREHRAAAGASKRVALRAKYSGLFEDAADALVGAEIAHIRKNAKKHLTARRRPEFDEWLTEYYGGEFQDFAAKKLEPIYRAYVEEIGPIAMVEVDATELPEEFQDIAERYAQTHAERHARSSSGQIRSVLDAAEADPVEAIDAKLDLWGETRPAREGRRNGSQAGESLARAVFVSAGFGLVWRTQGKSCDLCNQLDGVRVGGSSSFLAAGDTLSPQGVAPLTVSQSITHAPLHDGCDCYVVPG